jgi:drug/metabolite transporter (DMT)-like permease
MRVTLVSRSAGLLTLVGLGLALRLPPPRPDDALIGIVVGLSGGMGLLLLYMSLARGKMGIAAPLTAVAAGGIPLIVGLVSDGLPGAPQLAGFALALCAIWVISQSNDVERIRPIDIGLPLLAGVGIGIDLSLIGRIGGESVVVWVLAVARLTSIGLIGSATLVAARRGAGQRASGEESRGSRRLALLAGVGDVIGTGCFALSAELGRLDVAAVLGALYPAATVLLARFVLGERLSPRQSAGVGLALAAVVLIAL